MSFQKGLIAFVLADFTALTAYAVFQTGFVGFFTSGMATIAGITVFADLLIALTLVMAWMVRDARSRNMNVTPYLALTMCLGSVGPLLYLLRRPEEEPRPVRA